MANPTWRMLPVPCLVMNDVIMTSLLLLKVIYTAISRKIVVKNVHATIPNCNMGFDQDAVPDTLAVEPTFAAFL